VLRMIKVPRCRLPVPKYCEECERIETHVIPVKAHTYHCVNCHPSEIDCLGHRRSWDDREQGYTYCGI
jgi:hypothetical protein